MANQIPASALERDRLRKQTIAFECAIHGEPGDVYFHESSSRPLVSMFITTGELKDGSSTDHETHVHMVGQHNDYPVRIQNYEQIMEKGYEIFCEKNDQSTATLSGMARTAYTLKQYKARFRDVSRVIEDAIYTNHGVECFEDGDIYNRSDHNMYYLHICDIFNIMVHEASHRQIELLITTDSLPRISDGMKHVFQEELLNRNQCFFLLKNMDIFYMLYGYYGNNSFIPIRTRMVRRSFLFTMSCFLMNDDHFVEHQRGKLKEINQTEPMEITRLMYRTI
jgi:hypothetical protein